MLRSVDSFQNRVLADQYHMSISRAQVSTHRGYFFYKVIRRQVTSFQLIAGSTPLLCDGYKFIKKIADSVKWPCLTL